MQTVTYYCDLCEKELKEKSNIYVGINYRYSSSRDEWVETNEVCNECLISLGLTMEEDFYFPEEHPNRYKVVRDSRIYKEDGFKNFFKKILNINKK